MNIEFVKLDNVRGELTLKVEEKDYADKVKAQLKEVAKTHKEPGFRPGHVPAGLINKKYGKAVKYDVVNKTTGDAVFNYIKENNLHVLGNPVADKENTYNEDATEFTFKFKLGLAPEIENPVNKELHIPYYNIRINDDMLTRQDEALCKRFGKQVPGDTVEPNALVKGEIIELDENGNVKEGGIVVENGIVAPQYFKSEDQKNLFVGKHVGDEIVFNPYATCEGSDVELSSMLNIEKSDVKNHQGDFRMKVKEIIVLKPAEHDQEFFDMVFGKDKVHNEEECKEQLTEMIKNSLTNDSNYRFTIDAGKILQDKIGDIELPDEILKEFLMMQNKELTEANIDEEYTKIRPQLVWDLVKDAIARALEVKVSEEDLLDTAKLIALSQLRQYGMTNVPDEMLDKYAKEILKDENAKNQVVNQTFEFNFYDAVRNAASIDEKDVDVEEFNDLFRNATEAAAE